MQSHWQVGIQCTAPPHLLPPSRPPAPFPPLASSVAPLFFHTTRPCCQPTNPLTHPLTNTADEHDPQRMSPASWEEMSDPADEYLQVAGWVGSCSPGEVAGWVEWTRVSGS